MVPEVPLRRWFGLCKRPLFAAFSVHRAPEYAVQEGDQGADDPLVHTDEKPSLRAALAEEARRLVLQCCCAAGGLAGLWLGFWAAPKHDSSPRLLEALAQVLVPVGLHVGLGVVAGALVAWLAMVAVPALRPDPQLR
jgi:hypothetical protein